MPFMGLLTLPLTVLLLWHDGPPVCLSHNIRVDHFKGGGSTTTRLRSQ